MTTTSILFAAGRGRRLRPLTDVIPKPALPILDIPLGFFALRALLRVSPTVTINVRHLGEQVTRALIPHLRANQRLEVLDEVPEAYGTAGTLAALRERVPERALTWNSDVISDLDPQRLLAAHERAGGRGTIAVRRVSRRADAVIGGGRVARIVDRRREPDASGAQYLGMAVFEASALELIPETVPLGLVPGLLEPLAEAGELGAYVHEGYWADCGTIGAYLAVSLDLLNGVGPQLPPTTGEVLEVDEGRAYIGHRAQAPESALGPGAILLAGASVAPGATVRNSIVWPNEHAEKSLSKCVWALGGAHSAAEGPFSP